MCKILSIIYAIIQVIALLFTLHLFGEYWFWYLLGGLFVTLLISVPIYNIGDNNERLERIENSLNTLKKNLSDSKPQQIITSGNIKQKPATTAVSSNTSFSQTENPTEWKCPACGKIHKMYVTTCTCGTAQEI